MTARILSPVYTFTGTIEQTPTPTRSCGFEASQQGYGIPPVDTVMQFSSAPGFECKESEYSWDNLQSLHQYFQVINENSVNGFWKKRLIVRLLISNSFFSATFIPKTLYPKENRILYVQKGGNKELGFTAPYFLRDLKVAEYDQIDSQSILPVWDELSIQRTIGDVSETVRPNLQECLDYFLQDETTSRLGLIFKDGDEMVCRCWLKA